MFDKQMPLYLFKQNKEYMTDAVIAGKVSGIGIFLCLFFSNDLLQSKIIQLLPIIYLFL